METERHIETQTDADTRTDTPKQKHKPTQTESRQRHRRQRQTDGWTDRQADRRAPACTHAETRTDAHTHKHTRTPYMRTLQEDEFVGQVHAHSGNPTLTTCCFSQLPAGMSVEHSIWAQVHILWAIFSSRWVLCVFLLMELRRTAKDLELAIRLSLQPALPEPVPAVPELVPAVLEPQEQPARGRWSRRKQ